MAKRRDVGRPRYRGALLGLYFKVEWPSAEWGSDSGTERGVEWGFDRAPTKVAAESTTTAPIDVPTGEPSERGPEMASRWAFEVAERRGVGASRWSVEVWERRGG